MICPYSLAERDTESKQHRLKQIFLFSKTLSTADVARVQHTMNERRSSSVKENGDIVRIQLCLLSFCKETMHLDRPRKKHVQTHYIKSVAAKGPFTPVIY